jgi:plastocyanin
MRNLLLISLSSILITGCTHSSKSLPSSILPPASQSAETQTNIEIKDFTFSPQTITVKPGQVIMITNRDSAKHDFAADDGKSFNTELISTDQSVLVTAPQNPGEYPYHCNPHPTMKGTLIVEP